MGAWSNLALSTYYNLADRGYLQRCTLNCNYDVPMRATLIRSNALANPGSIRAQMQVTYN